MGRNAAGISCDTIHAALLAVRVNPKDIVDLWHGEISHQINLSFKTEGGVMACLTADTIDLPNGVNRGILDLTSQPASVNPSAPSANRPRLSDAVRLKGRTATTSDVNRPFYLVPDSVVPEITMEVREEHWDKSLWRNSLKLHLTGRNAAGISRDAIRPVGCRGQPQGYRRLVAWRD